MPLLDVRGVSRSFGGLHAVNNVSFAVEAGRIKAVIGPNGAGKTTLFNLIAGALRVDRGEVLFDNRPLHRLPPHRIAQSGVARTFQNIKLFKGMSVLDNVMLGAHTRSRGDVWAGMLSLPFTWREEARVRARALELLDLLEIRHLAEEDATRLAFGQQRAVEFARALALEPKLLLLDEPAAGMNIRETAGLGALIRRIRDLGVTILLVEHDMSLVMEVSEEIVVLSFGQTIAEGTPQEVRRNPDVIRVYLGADNVES